MPDVTVRVNVNLSQEESETFLANIIMSGVLNYGHSLDPKQYPTLSDDRAAGYKNNIEVIRKKTVDDPKLYHILMSAAPYDKQNEFIEQALGMIDMVNEWISANKEKIHSTFLAYHDGLCLYITRNSVRIDFEFEEKIAELQYELCKIKIARNFDLIKIECYPPGVNMIVSDAYQLKGSHV